MSSRVLKKSQNDDDLLKSILDSTIKESQKDEPSPAKVNNFMSLLANDDDDEEEDEEKEHSDKSDDDINDEPIIDSFKKISLPSKSQRKRNNKKKKKKQQKKNNNSQSLDDNDDDENDEELDKLLQQFQKQDIMKYGKKKEKLDTSSIKFDSEDDDFYSLSEDNDNDSDTDLATKRANINKIFSMKDDTSFSKFTPKYLNTFKKFFNADFKALDPHTEFKLLFDDLSAKSLEDIDSMSSTAISPQQLKQIQRMRRLVRNWDGKDHRNVPNGPGGSTHRLQFTKIRTDWLPTPRGEVVMQSLTSDEILEWQLWQRPTDWKDVIENDLKKFKNQIKYFKFSPLNSDLTKKAMSEFYLSVILHPDHEALISLISSKFPYFVPGLLQVSLILIRQGDNSNTNGLLQRALFVFDRAFKIGVNFDGLSCQLPYIYFFNRQFYLAIFRYIAILAQRGAVATAGAWSKALWSLSPLEDPLGCRYFIDHYLILNKEYQYLIEISQSPLITTYQEWFTLGFSMGVVLSYLSIDELELARTALNKAFKCHALSLSYIFTEKLAGDITLTKKLDIEKNPISKIECKAYLARFSQLWTSPNHTAFLNTEISRLLNEYNNGHFKILPTKFINDSENDNEFFTEGIPTNLLRFAILSGESSVMGSIPEDIWSDYQVYEFDVLPPQPNSRESEDTIETVKSFINDRELEASQMERLQDETLLNQIRQMSLDQFLEENPNAGLD